MSLLDPVPSLTVTYYPLCSVKRDISGVMIRPARREDYTAVRKLIQELADWEEMPDGPKLDAKGECKNDSSKGCLPGHMT